MGLCVTSHNISAVEETIIVSRCFVGCLGQARKRCSNHWCCGPHNYASDVRPTDQLAAGVESPSETLAPGVVFCTATTGLKYIKNKTSRLIEGSRHWYDT